MEIMLSHLGISMTYDALDGLDIHAQRLHIEITVCTIAYRKDQEDVGRDLNDLLINRLIVEELNALVVNIEVCTLQNRGDNAAITQSIIIGLGAAAEGVCEEGLCQINIAAVGSDVQAAAAVGGIALAAV